MRRVFRMGIALVAMGLLTSGCFGPFNLTRRLYQGNEQVQGKWEREAIFVVLAWLPVYGLAVAGDAIVFNSMEFWTGNNPVDAPTANRRAVPQTKRIVHGEDETLLTYTHTANGGELLIEQFQSGEPAGSLRVQQRNGAAVGYDADGKALLTSRSLADGSILVHDAQGRQVASYSADEVQQFLR